VLQQPSANLTIIAINHPAGRWRLATESGSPPIRRALGARTLPTPMVSARVTGHGHKRTIIYHTRPLPDQRITFAEIGPRTHRVIATANASSGRITFTPGDGPAGTRRIVAIVTLGRIPARQLTVAAYTAPRPSTPTDPSAVRIAQAGHGALTVRWAAGSDVAQYRVTVTLSDGTRLFRVVPSNRRSATFPPAPPGTSATATVQAQRTNGGLGALVPSHPHKPARGCHNTNHAPTATCPVQP
jgi:hypothetical protein